MRIEIEVHATQRRAGRPSSGSQDPSRRRKEVVKRGARRSVGVREAVADARIGADQSRGVAGSGSILRRRLAMWTRSTCVSSW